MLDSTSLVSATSGTEARDAVFAEHRPDVVFHAAALKHLPAAARRTRPRR